MQMSTHNADPCAMCVWGQRLHSYQKIMRDLREDADKTQAEIAAILRTSQTMYARYERGASELPIRRLLTLCDYYQISADEFLGRDNPCGNKN